MSDYLPAKFAQIYGEPPARRARELTLIPGRHDHKLNARAHLALAVFELASLVRVLSHLAVFRAYMQSHVPALLANKASSSSTLFS